MTMQIDKKSDKIFKFISGNDCNKNNGLFYFSITSMTFWLFILVFTIESVFLILYSLPSSKTFLINLISYQKQFQVGNKYTLEQYILFDYIYTHLNTDKSKHQTLISTSCVAKTIIIKMLINIIPLMF